MNNDDIIKQIREKYNRVLDLRKSVAEVRYHRRTVVGKLLEQAPEYLARKQFAENEAKREEECKKNKVEFVPKQFDKTDIGAYELQFASQDDEEAEKLLTEYAALKYKTAMTDLAGTEIDGWVARDILAKLDQEKKAAVEEETKIRTEVKKLLNVLCSSPKKLFSDQYTDLRTISASLSISQRRLRTHERHAKRY